LVEPLMILSHRKSSKTTSDGCGGPGTTQPQNTDWIEGVAPRSPGRRQCHGAVGPLGGSRRSIWRGLQKHWCFTKARLAPKPSADSIRSSGPAGHDVDICGAWASRRGLQPWGFSPGPHSCWHFPAQYVQALSTDTARVTVAPSGCCNRISERFTLWDKSRGAAHFRVFARTSSFPGGNRTTRLWDMRPAMCAGAGSNPGPDACSMVLPQPEWTV